MRAVVICNEDDPDAGFVGERLVEVGYVLERGARERPRDWPGLAGADLVLLLGSEWHVYDPATAASVAAEADLVRAASAGDVPVLGICFGAQVIAHALGGTVSLAPAPEIGWIDIAVADPPAGPPIATGPWMSWHADVFTAPPGATVLAHNDVGPQLVATGRIVGTQFHPEATATMVASWLERGGADALRSAGGDPDALRASTRASVERSEPAARALVDWFLARVARGGTDPS